MVVVVAEVSVVVAGVAVVVTCCEPTSPTGVMAWGADSLQPVSARRAAATVRVKRRREFMTWFLSASCGLPEAMWGRANPGAKCRDCPTCYLASPPWVPATKGAAGSGLSSDHPLRA